MHREYARCDISRQHGLTILVRPSMDHTTDITAGAAPRPAVPARRDRPRRPPPHLRTGPGPGPDLRAPTQDHRSARPGRSRNHGPRLRRTRHGRHPATSAGNSPRTPARAREHVGVRISRSHTHPLHRTAPGRSSACPDRRSQPVEPDRTAGTGTAVVAASSTRGPRTRAFARVPSYPAAVVRARRSYTRLPPCRGRPAGEPSGYMTVYPAFFSAPTTDSQ